MSYSIVLLSVVNMAYESFIKMLCTLCMFIIHVVCLFCFYLFCFYFICLFALFTKLHVCCI